MCFLPRGRSNSLVRAKLGPLRPLCLVRTALVLRTWRSMNRPISAQSAVLSERELCAWIYYPRCPSVNASAPSNAARRNRGRKPTLTRRIFRCSGPGFPESRLYSTTSHFPLSMAALQRSGPRASSIISGGTAVSVATSFDVGHGGPRIVMETDAVRFDRDSTVRMAQRLLALLSTAIDAPARPVSHLSRLLAFDRRALENIQASTEQKRHIVGGDLVSPLKEALARSSRPALVFRDEVLPAHTLIERAIRIATWVRLQGGGSRRIRCCQLPSSGARHRSHPRSVVLWRCLRTN